MVALFFTGGTRCVYPSRVTRVPEWDGRPTHAAVLDHVDLAIVSTDVDGLVTTWNTRAVALYGWQASEAIGRSIVELLVAPGEEQLVDEIRRTLSAGKTWQGSMRLKRRDGSLLKAFVKNSPLRNGEGRIHGIVGVSIELTDPELISAIRAAGIASSRAGGRQRTLSPREREILGMLARGLTGEQIAERLVLSPETIRTHIRNAREKLGASTRVEAVTIALVGREIEI
jgi:PAS domain S-box-containing protein